MAPSTFRSKENKTIFTADYWKVGWFADVARYAEALAPVLQAHFGTTKLLAGDGVRCCSVSGEPVEAGSWLYDSLAARQAYDVRYSLAY